jgi:hypothetical protein
MKRIVTPLPRSRRRGTLTCTDPVDRLVFRRKFLWISQPGDRISRYVAHLFLRRELQRVDNAMICATLRDYYQLLAISPNLASDGSTWRFGSTNGFSDNKHRVHLLRNRSIAPAVTAP